MSDLDYDIVFPDEAPIVARFVVVRKRVRVDEELHWTECGIPMQMHRFETRIKFESVPHPVWHTDPI